MQPYTHIHTQAHVWNQRVLKYVWLMNVWSDAAVAWSRMRLSASNNQGDSKTSRESNNNEIYPQNHIKSSNYNKQLTN